MKTLDGQKTQDLGLFAGKLSQDQHANVLKWIEALRSGEYEQGTGFLKRSNGSYCCLGVANEVLHLGNHGTSSFLNVGCGRVGLRASGGGMFTTEALWRLNDSSDWSFLEIAQLIEDQMNIVGWES